MPIFTIETAYHLPVFRQRTCEAETIEQACRLALRDDDCSDERLDYETAGDTYVCGVWQDIDAAHRGPSLPVPTRFAETIARKAEYFGTLLGIVKMLATSKGVTSSDLKVWLPHALAAVAEAEAILASASNAG